MRYLGRVGVFVTVVVALTVLLSCCARAQEKKDEAKGVTKEDALYESIAAKIGQTPPTDIASQERLKWAKAHLAEIAKLCEEYVTQYPKGKEVVTVKIHQCHAEYYLARYSQDERGSEKAAEKMEALLKEYPKEKAVDSLRGLLYQHYVARDDLAKAVVHVRYFAEMAEDEKMAAGAWMAVSQMETMLERYDEAKAALKIVLEKYPRSEPAAYAKVSLKLLERVGQPLEMKFTSVAGKAIDMKDYKGKVVLVDFWASWCKPCRDEMPNVVKLYREKQEDGFEILGISLDSKKDEMTAYVKQAGMTWPQYYDGKGWGNEVARLFDIHGIPATFIVDRKGVLRAMNLRGPKLAERVEMLLKEKADKKD